jgi:hypothetical protein
MRLVLYLNFVKDIKKFTEFPLRRERNTSQHLSELPSASTVERKANYLGETANTNKDLSGVNKNQWCFLRITMFKSE